MTTSVESKDQTINLKCFEYDKREDFNIQYLLV